MHLYLYFVSLNEKKILNNIKQNHTLTHTQIEIRIVKIKKNYLKQKAKVQKRAQSGVTSEIPKKDKIIQKNQQINNHTNTKTHTDTFSLSFIVSIT